MTNSFKPQSTEGSWTEWSKFVLKELERNNDSIESLRKQMQDSNVLMATLQTKVYIICCGIGFVGGILGTIIARTVTH